MKIENGKMEAKNLLIIVLDREGAKQVEQLSGFTFSGDMKFDECRVAGAVTVLGRLRLSVLALQAVWLGTLPSW